LGKVLAGWKPKSFGRQTVQGLSASHKGYEKDSAALRGLGSVEAGLGWGLASRKIQVRRARLEDDLQARD
jgi:hypothetical protein